MRLRARGKMYSVEGMDATYFRRGFGRGKEVEALVQAEYHSALVDRLQRNGFEETFGAGDQRLTIRLAEAFGFCYGVDRAIDYAYQTRLQFPDRRILLVGEIIHNPFVNDRLRARGIEFLYPGPDGFDFRDVGPEDVVVLPAFGVTVQDFERLRRIGCIIVDTTCGSVLNVWKRVEQYARDGYTALIHGKYWHEETRATASQVTKYPGGTYVVVRDMEETRLLLDYIERRPTALSREALQAHFREKASPHFDPDVHLERIGVANQTTMLAGESLAIAAAVGEALARRYGDRPGFDLAWHFRSFDTICSATQERQDAVAKLLAHPDGPPDVMVVIGGYNSSNTNHLAVLCAARTITYHIADADRIDPARGTIRFKPAGTPADAPEVEAEAWLPPGPVVVGLTAGASTPNVKIGEAVVRILATRGLAAPDLSADVPLPSGA